MKSRDEKKDTEEKKPGHLREHKSYTAWHIFPADVMDYFFDPNELEVQPFEKLGSLPLESDFIIIRKKGSMPEILRLYPDFGYLIPYPGEITVIEYKSPLDTLRHTESERLTKR